MSIWSRLFPRKPPVEDRRCMNEDWRVGDLAECVWGDWMSVPAPRVGQLLVVNGITDGIANTPMNGPRCYFLHFDGCGTNGFESTAFRKIRPVHIAADAEFTALIRLLVKA